MRRRIGVSLQRTQTAFVCLEKDGGPVVFSRAADRQKSQPVADLLRAVLQDIPIEFKNAEISIAVGAGDLACCDCFAVPFDSEGAIENVIGSLAESRCAGESAEELAIDFACHRAGVGLGVTIVAISHQQLQALREVVTQELPHATLISLTSVPIAVMSGLKDQKSSLAYSACGEAFFSHSENGTPRWRSFPLDGSADEKKEKLRHILTASGIELDAAVIACDEEPIRFLNQDVQCSLVAALAAANLTSGSSLNLLRGANDAPKSLVSQIRKTLMVAGLAAAILLVVLGLSFEKDRLAYNQKIKSLAVTEKKLWGEVFPGKPVRDDQLSREMERSIKFAFESQKAGEFPSALSFWSEIGAAMPPADQTGMQLDSVQLGTDGGRISGKVARGTTDALSNAALLEHSLNNASALTARAEFETRESDIVVRLRLEYQDAPSPNSKRAKK